MAEDRNLAQSAFLLLAFGDMRGELILYFVSNSCRQLSEHVCGSFAHLFALCLTVYCMYVRNILHLLHR